LAEAPKHRWLNDGHVGDRGTVRRCRDMGRLVSTQGGK